MNCDGMRGLLSAYLDGELSSGELLRVEQHLRRCHWCAEEVESLRETVSLVTGLREVELPADFHAGLHARLVAVGAPAVAASLQPAPLWQRRLRTWALPAAAAAAILAVGLNTMQKMDLEGLTGTSIFETARAPVAQSGTGQAPSTGASAGPSAPTAVVDGNTTPDPGAVAFNSSDPPQTASAVPASTEAKPDPPTSTPVGPTAAAAPGSAYAVSFLHEVPAMAALPTAEYVSYNLTTTANSAEVVDRLKLLFPTVQLTGASALVTVPASEAPEALKQIGSIVSVDPVTVKPVSSDLSSSLAVAYDQLRSLDLTREQLLKVQSGSTDPSVIELKEAELSSLKSEADKVLENVKWMQARLSEVTIKIDFQKLPASLQ